MAAKSARFEVYPSKVTMLGGYTATEKITLKAAPGADWRWRLARNGEILASGEGFTRKADAERAVRAVKRAVLAIDARERA